MQLKPVIKGLLTFAPGIDRLTCGGTGGTNSSRYCYSVWLRHMVMANRNGLDTSTESVAELGPGDSLGIGIAALLSGSAKYYAFDIVEHADIGKNIAVFDELVELFSDREKIPGDDEFPSLNPRLDNYDFPSDILNEKRLSDSLNEDRLKKIRNSLIDPNSKDSMISYKAPWNESSLIEKDLIDMIYSQAVLEHVDDLSDTYKKMHEWLKPNGYMSHQIDFSCHGTAKEWNGHWQYPDILWKIARGRRAYFINREPHSTHIKLLEKEGFHVVCDETVRKKSNLKSDELAGKYKSLIAEDLRIKGTFIQASKKA